MIKSLISIFSGQLFKSFSIYTFSSLICKAVPFFLLPVFTAYLTPADYGVISIMLAGVLAITPLLGPGVNDLFTVEYQKLNKEELKEYVSTSILLSLIVFSFLFVLIFFLQDNIVSTFGISQIVVFAIPIIALMSFSFEYFLNILRNEDKPVSYSKLSISRTILELGFSTILIVAYKAGYLGRVSGIVITGVIYAIIFISFLLKRGYLTLSFKKKYFSSILRFGLPTIPFFIMIFVLNNSDKYIVSNILGIDDVGIYGIATTISVISNVALTSFLVPFMPYLYEQLAANTKASRLQVVRVSYIFVIFFSIANLAIYFISPLLFEFFIDEKFYEAILYIGPLLMGQVFWALFMIVTASYIYFYKKTTFYYFLSPAIISISLIFTYVLTKNYGLTGTSFAYLFSNISLFLLSLIYFKYYPVRLPWFNFKYIINGDSSKTK